MEYGSQPTIDKDNVIYGGPVTTNVAKDYKSFGDFMFKRLNENKDVVVLVNI